MEPMDTTIPNSSVEKHGKQSVHYLGNSLEFLEKKELRRLVSSAGEASHKH